MRRDTSKESPPTRAPAATRGTGKVFLPAQSGRIRRGQSGRVLPASDGVEGVQCREGFTLIELLIVKYPGIEQVDVEHFFHALDIGDVELVERIEADMASKSARWKRAALEL